MWRNRTLTIEAFPQSAFRHLERDAIVCIDVICTTTTLVTAVSKGRASFAVASLEEAYELKRRLRSPLLVGEIERRGTETVVFPDSPSYIDRRADTWRPLVLVATPGAKLIANAAACPAVYIASFQNLSATVERIAAEHDHVALLGAGAGGEFRIEDQMAAAWMAAMLQRYGFVGEDMRTTELIRRWREAEAALVKLGNSAADLRRRNVLEDLDFVLSHVDDCDLVCRLEGPRVTPAPQWSVPREVSRWPYGVSHAR